METSGDPLQLLQQVTVAITNGVKKMTRPLVDLCQEEHAVRPQGGGQEVPAVCGGQSHKASGVRLKTESYM